MLTQHNSMMGPARSSGPAPLSEAELDAVAGGFSFSGFIGDLIKKVLTTSGGVGGTTNTGGNGGNGGNAGSPA